MKKYGSLKPLADALRSGKILGVVNVVGCNNPKVMYEKAILDVVDVLLKNNILILTNGCASFPIIVFWFGIGGVPAVVIIFIAGFFL